MKISDYIKIAYDDNESIYSYQHLTKRETFEWIYWDRQDYKFEPIINLENECINDSHFQKDITLLRFEYLYLEIYNEIYNMGLHKDKSLNQNNPDIENAFEDFKKKFDLYKSNSDDYLDNFYLGTFGSQLDGFSKGTRSKNLFTLLVIKVIYRYYLDILSNNDRIINIQDREIYFKGDIDILDTDLTYKLYPISYITFFGKGSFFELRENYNTIKRRSIISTNEEKWEKWFMDKIKLDIRSNKIKHLLEFK